MQTATNSPGDPRVTTAFLLGWSLSELLGHLRKGTRPRSQTVPSPPDSAPRLDVSFGTVEKNTDGMYLAAQRIVQLYLQLGFESPDKATALSQQIFTLPEKLGDWLEGKAKDFNSPRDLRELLNAWSLQVWARLEGESQLSAQAFTTGISIADTYWYLRLPLRRRKKVLSAEDWRRLLSKYRMDVERTRLRTLEECMPPYIAAVLRNHLKEWSIGTELALRDGRLVRIGEPAQNEALPAKEESLLQHALARQMRNWEAMVFGQRTALSYLHSSDRRLIAVLRGVGLFLVLLATAILLLAIAVVVAYFFALGPLPLLLDILNQRQASISEWLAVVSLLWTILIAVPVPIAIRAAYQGTRSIQQWLDDTLTTWFITRRTYVPWDRYMKKMKEERGEKREAG